MPIFPGFPLYNLEDGGTFVFHLQGLPEGSPAGFVTFYDYNLSNIVGAQGYEEDKLFATKGDKPYNVLSLSDNQNGDEENIPWVYYTGSLKVDNVIARRLEVKATGPVTVALFYDKKESEEYEFNRAEQTHRRSLKGYRAKRLIIRVQGEGDTKLKLLRLAVIPKDSLYRRYGNEAVE